jgi:hypothetical protein
MSCHPGGQSGRLGHHLPERPPVGRSEAARHQLFERLRFGTDPSVQKTIPLTIRITPA